MLSVGDQAGEIKTRSGRMSNKANCNNRYLVLVPVPL
ncbi:hypothetical protein GGP50_000472 [Salinibacter ruber]|nr:hypothetical protein [Salinibacter ruber]MCS3667491.1 hypothetical protein [Salinibacter ruber]MCS3826928.1 hypothetical protein [Salinibacter ruber]MCS4143656.1 hypothetical protein [Salinibacter ruber]MCS4192277.1 hypothetical protein [Salinibacter ruber]